MRLNRQPSNIKGGTLKNYQLVGVNWLISLNEIGVNGILADQMGLGKTIQTIAFLGYLLEHKGRRGPYLIVGPTTVMGNWMRELKKWLPDLRAVKLLARKEYRYEIFEKYIRPRKFDIIVTSYEGVNICKKELSKINWHYLIVDEAHRLKNEHSMFSRNIRNYRKDFVLLITGTPIQNNIHELWALLNFIMPDLFDDSEVFDTYSNFDESLSEKEREKKNLKYIQSLHRILRPFILKRTKDELALTLPPKKEIHLFIGLTKLQVELYRKILLKRPLSGEKESYKNVLMQLRKCCDHPYLFEGIEPEDADPAGEHVIEVSSKLVVVDKLLKKLHGGNHQILIFSQFKITLNVLEDYLNIRGYKYCRFDGDTNLEEREKAINDFTEPNSDKFVFLLSTRAGGLGINLMTADTVVLYDSDWNPQVDLQAMDRAHRIGQKNTVMVYRLICENTVEEKMIERQQIKLKWDQLVILKGKISQKKSKYDKEELKDLISFGANDIFRMEGGTFRDEDIDAILIRGEQRTGELNQKLDQMIKQKREQILNLEVNSINLYEFMGQELYNKKDREELKSRWEQQQVRTKMGKRVIKYHLAEEDAEDLSLLGETEKKVVRVHDFQYFSDKERVEELLNRKEDLDEEETEELKVKQDKGFRSWTKNDFYMFVRFLEQNDEVDLKELATVLKKSEQEVHRFYERFRDEINHLTDKKKLNERFMKAQKQRRFQATVKEVLERKMEGVTSPNEVTLRSQFYNKVKSKMYRRQHDQFIIFKCHEFGMQSVEKIKRGLRNYRLFKFDIFIKSIKEATLNKRINSLMKMLINESNYIQENKEKQMQGAKFSQNCFLMGFKGVYEEGQEHARKKEAQEKELQEKLEKEKQEWDRLERERIEREQRKQQELILKAELEKKTKGSRKNGESMKQRIQPQTDQGQNLLRKRKEGQVETVLVPNAEQMVRQGGYKRLKQDTRGPQQAHVNYKQCLYMFIDGAIQTMKKQGFSFSPKHKNFTIEELASKFLQIPDIASNPDLMGLLPHNLKLHLMDMSRPEFKTPVPNLPPQSRGFGMTRGGEHLPEMGVPQPEPKDMRHYMMQGYPYKPMRVNKAFQEVDSRQQNAMYVKNFNNINNINNYYMKSYGNMNPVYPSNEMMFDRHYQSPAPMMREHQMHFAVPYLSRYSWLTLQRFMPNHLSSRPPLYKPPNERQYQLKRPPRDNMSFPDPKQ